MCRGENTAGCMQEFRMGDDAMVDICLCIIYELSALSRENTERQSIQRRPILFIFFHHLLYPDKHSQVQFYSAQYNVNALTLNRLGGLNLCIAWGGAFGAAPQKKALENRYRVQMHVHSPIFQGQLREKKIRPITLIVWVLGRVKKMPKKG